MYGRVLSYNIKFKSGPIERRLRVLSPRRCYAQQNITKVEKHKETLQVSLSSGQVLEFPYPWLRESCPGSLNPASLQRGAHSAVVDRHFNAEVKDVALEPSQNTVTVSWRDGGKSCFSLDWLLYQNNKKPCHSWYQDAKAWSKKDWTNESLPEVKYSPDSSNLCELTTKISKYGFCFVNGVPACPEKTKRVAEMFGGQLYMNPLWGDFWDYSVDTEKALGAIRDTAYTGDFIPPHTDGTYLQESPGLQFFHVLEFKGTGGLNQIVDGLTIANKLKDSRPELYDFLTKYPFEWYHKSPGTNYRSFQPVLSLDYENNLRQLRFNDLDRAPPPSSLDKAQMDLYYKSLRAFAELSLDPDNQVEFLLEPGRVMIVNNWRVMHARSDFLGQRRICGCYVPMDLFRSIHSVSTQDEIYV